MRSTYLNPKRQGVIAERIDMLGNIKDLMDAYTRLRQNPLQMLNIKFKIPQDVDMSNPDAILKYLMNTGQVNQEQINQVMQMRNTPMVQRLMGS